MTKWTRKDYEAVAKILRTSNVVEDVTHRLADMFQIDNSRFDRERFVQASDPLGDHH